MVDKNRLRFGGLAAVTHGAGVSDHGRSIHPGFAIGDLGSMQVKVPYHLTELLDEKLTPPSMTLLPQRSASARPHQALRILQVIHALQSR
jgi:hypothetical protein